MKQKGFAPILIVIGVLILGGIVGGAYYLGQRNTLPSSPKDYSNINSFEDCVKARFPVAESYPLQCFTPEGKSFTQILPTTSITTNPIPQTNKTNEPAVTQKPNATSKTVTIPSNWKKYTAEDPDFGIKTSMSMPSGYSFRFTGSEFNIENDSDATELWDYSSSVYRDNDGVLKNHYDGSSRRVWYEKRLSERRVTDKIVSVKEKPLNATTYLEITVQTPSYDERGVTSGTKNGIHYVYVQNNILHMITPASNKAYTSAAQISGNIESILASITSIQTK